MHEEARIRFHCVESVNSRLTVSEKHPCFGMAGVLRCSWASRFRFSVAACTTSFVTNPDDGAL